MKRIEKKIRKLLALAKNDAASDTEAETALRQAHALAAKHSVSVAMLIDSEEVEIDDNTIIICLREGRCRHVLTERLIIVLDYMYPAISYESKNGSNVFSYHVAVAREFSNSVVTTYAFIHEQIRQQRKIALKKEAFDLKTKKGRKLYQRFIINFNWSCAERLIKRAKRIHENLSSNDEYARSMTGQNALTVVNSRKMLIDKVNRDLLLEHGIKLESVNVKAKIGDGTLEGMQAANNINLQNVI